MRVKDVHMLLMVDGSGNYRQVSRGELSRLSDRLAKDGARLSQVDATPDEEAGTVTYYWERQSELFTVDNYGACDPLFDVAHGRTGR